MPPLAFLSPLFLLGAAAAAVPVVLHLLKRNPETRLKFSAVRLLRNAPVEHTSRRRLRELLLLALRVMALILLAVGFARPFLRSGAYSGSGPVTVVALDTSLSMSAPGQFERAKEMARTAIAGAPRGTRIAVLAFAEAARVLASPSADRRAATRAVDQAAPGIGSTRYRAALAGAADLLQGSGGTIVVVTDLQATGWDSGERGSVPASARVEIADVGPPPPNLAITSARLVGDRIVATVRNSAPGPREARVHLRVEGQGSSIDATAAVGANQSTEVRFPAVRG